MQKSGGLIINLSRELYLELNDQVTMLICSLVERHTKVLTGEKGVRLDHLSWFVLNSDLTPVEVGQNEVKTS